MGLLEKAYFTYENIKDKIGIETAGEEPLCPVSHMIANSQIEIWITADGKFDSASAVPKDNMRTIIPVTMESSSRTVSADKTPHPLLDQLMFLTNAFSKSYDCYIDALKKWAESSNSHPKVRAIFSYISGWTILKDLSMAGVIELKTDGTLNNGKINGTDYAKCLVRFVVLGDGEYSETWRDTSLFESWTEYYYEIIKKFETGLCELSWKQEPIAKYHPKGTINFSKSNGAKLISANDNSGFTYRGRFRTPNEAAEIGYTASQKAHNALRWLCSNHGVRIGDRMFLWWKPSGEKMEMPGCYLFGTEQSNNPEFISFRDELFKTLSGYRSMMKPDDDIVVTALEAATTRRLSVTYYSELKAQDFWDRIETWYSGICYNEHGNSPSLKQIALCAYGNEREGDKNSYLDLNDKLLAKITDRLLHCVIDKRPIPTDIAEAIAKKFAQPQAYKTQYNKIAKTAFSLTRKYRNDKYKEDWKLGIDRNETDRSYLYGRLLALFDRLENATYDDNDRRDTNAAKIHSVYVRRPAYALTILEDRLVPYRSKLAKSKPGLFYWFNHEEAEIMDKLDPNDPKRNDPLDSRYILGYYHQMKAKKIEDNDEENKQ